MEGGREAARIMKTQQQNKTCDFDTNLLNGLH